MGHLANILDFQAGRRPKVASAALAAPHVGDSDLARLIPGISDSEPLALTYPSILGTAAMHFLPRFCRRLDGGMLAPAMLDLSLLTLLFSLQVWALGSKSLPSPILCIYAFCFVVFAIQEDLYLSHKTEFSENAAACRAIVWATFFTGICLGWSAAPGSAIILLGFSFCTLGALVTARRLRRSFRPTEVPLRNVLIVGNGIKAARIANAIRRDRNSCRVLKGFITENDLCNNYGPAMLSRVAREEFIDELVIASSEPSVVDVAVQEGCKNKLDVKLAPDICIPVSADADLENLGGVPLFRIQVHPVPEYRLALKRSLDFALSISGLIALSPLLLVIAAFIKWDSAGPVLYCAPRTGRKGRRFVCYKFRTMVPDADSRKDQLRDRNEREGAFFKIDNDPRITQFGRFLRRYSLDELPQLWNVLLGDMSLVGPRPHPIDDVSQYELQHLQRLDFIPGITGLWQVTARRNPSFERNLELDIEYIKNWNLWLDVRILFKTVSAVFEGSGV
ncbi:MAG TPA: sugar transferase [Terriglobales bacterium]|jgi:exopolysaccharide biosynthesis polyprenyl glycosylphosphotransferase|nr:sugar transferase [Terriglobales bacterium]